MNKFLLGAHMPITGGFYHAPLFGQEVGCSAIQVFTKSNRQWQAKPITTDDANQFKNAVEQANINYVAAHASYLINLASPDLNTQHKSIDALIIELARCEQLGIQDLVLHPGSKIDLTLDKALTQVAQNINSVLANSPHQTKILIETGAGQGSSVGHTFEQLAKIIALVKDYSRVGICIDTCHVFSAGYDFTTPEKYRNFWHSFNHVLGKNMLALVHLNDSKKELNSRIDRHAEIGHGAIDLHAFKMIMNDLNLINIPKILETPKENLADDQRNIKKLIGLLENENLKYLKNTNLIKYL
jgi:deoxyribonuclease IV